MFCYKETSRFFCVENASDPYFTKAEIKDTTFYVLAVVYPILLASCTIGNVLNLIVLAHEKVKGSANTYMITVAVTDLLVLWTAFPDVLETTYRKLRHDKVFVRALRNYDGLRNWSHNSAVEVCDWILIVFSLERLIAITKPFACRSLQTLRTSRIVVVVLLVLAGISNLYTPVQHYSALAHHKGPKIPTGDALNYVPLWMADWLCMEVHSEPVLIIIKFFALLIINILIIVSIRKQSNSEAAKMRAIQANSGVRNRSSYYILLASVLLYLITQFPWMIFQSLSYAMILQTYCLPPSVRFYLMPFFTQLILVNYSINFFLYLTVSKRFRGQFIEVFRKLLYSRTFKSFFARFQQNREKLTHRRLPAKDVLENKTSNTAAIVPTNLRNNPAIIKRRELESSLTTRTEVADLEMDDLSSGEERRADDYHEQKSENTGSRFALNSGNPDRQPADDESSSIFMITTGSDKSSDDAKHQPHKLSTDSGY